METSEQLAAKIVNVLFPFDEFAQSQIPFVALSIVQHTPVLKTAPQAEIQFIFNEICAALASLQFAQIAAKSARYFA
jgi:hypothetical protein